MNAAHAGDLLARLQQVPDPRGAHGRRHSFSAMLATIVCAVLCGARGYEAIAQWIHAQDKSLWYLLGYPMIGSDMLLTAYGEALKANDFDAHQFVVQYCSREFGLSKADAETLWNGIAAPVEVLIDGASSLAIEELQQVQDSTKEFCDFLHEVPLQRNRESFEHFKLMYDIRLFFVETQIVRAEVEAMRDDQQTADALLVKLDDLRQKGLRLDDRFSKLHKDNLYPDAIELENSVRNQEVELLYRKVAKKIAYYGRRVQEVCHDKIFR